MLNIATEHLPHVRTLQMLFVELFILNTLETWVISNDYHSSLRRLTDGTPTILYGQNFLICISLNLAFSASFKGWQLRNAKVGIVYSSEQKV